MAYRKIHNLYKNKDILYFKQAYALEKVHGTSAHIGYRADQDKLIFFSGGANHENFLKLFDQEILLEKFRQNHQEHPDSNVITIYGEAYGGKLQAMSSTYGKELKFIAFEVKIDDTWFPVPEAERFAAKFDQEFVPYCVIDTSEEQINREMMADSEVAIRRGMGSGHMREGIVLRPLIEVVFQNGGRIICKHKRPEFAEREHTPKFTNPDKLKVLEEANAIANEWVNTVRLQHVLDWLGLSEPEMKDMNKVIKGMVEDVYTEAKGEIVESKETKKAIGKRTAKVFQEYLRNKTFD